MRLVLAIALLCAPAALAQAGDSQQKPAVAPVPAPSEVRVRASHKVDVIAPGERVETVLDRMRQNRSGTAGAATPRTKPEDRPAVRPPTPTRPGGADRGAEHGGGDHGGGEHHGGDHNGPPGPGPTPDHHERR